MPTTTRARGATLVAAALSLAAGLAAVPAAQAATVTYNTAPTELCLGASGCGVLTQSIGSVIVSYVPVNATVDADPWTFASLGSIVISCVGGGTACGSASLDGLNLYLDASQSVPSSGSALVATGALSGSVKGTSSTAMIAWTVGSDPTIGGVSYGVLSNPLVLVPPSTNGGASSIQGVIDASAVPVPAAAWLLGSALGLLGAVRLRKS